MTTQTKLPSYVICRYLPDGDVGHRIIGTTTLQYGTTQEDAERRLADQLADIAAETLPGRAEPWCKAHLTTW